MSVALPDRWRTSRWHVDEVLPDITALHIWKSLPHLGARRTTFGFLFESRPTGHALKFRTKRGHVHVASRYARFWKLLNSNHSWKIQTYKPRSIRQSLHQWAGFPPRCSLSCWTIFDCVRRLNSAWWEHWSLYHLRWILLIAEGFPTATICPFAFVEFISNSWKSLSNHDGPFTLPIGSNLELWRHPYQLG